jgi:UrcA family protein
MNAFKRSQLRVLGLALSVVAMCGTHGAIAGVASDRSGAQPSETVRVNDLDLRTHDGVAVLYLRIRNAARSVCGYADTVFLEEKAAWDQCVREAIESAIAKVGSDALTNYAATRTSRPASAFLRNYARNAR